ncbi:MAG: hypothetical protein LH614_12730 [Pyrinomonadaceae bacterium]|nr:hypothetical protein [Pyrinomonadaceae bacterium]
MNETDTETANVAPLPSIDWLDGALKENAEREAIDGKKRIFLGFSGHCTDDDCGLYTCNEDNECPRCGAYFVFHRK